MASDVTLHACVFSGTETLQFSLMGWMGGQGTPRKHILSDQLTLSNTGNCQ